MGEGRWTRGQKKLRRLEEKRAEIGGRGSKGKIIKVKGKF